MTDTRLAVPANIALESASSFDLVGDWLDWLRSEDRSEATLAAYQVGIEQWMDWLVTTGRHRGVVTPPDVMAYRAFLKDRYAVQTVNLRITPVRSFYRWMVNAGKLAVSPADTVGGASRRGEAHKRDPLSDDEVVRVLGTCDTSTPVGVRDRAIIMFKAYLGLRNIEVYRANLGSLRDVGGRMVIMLQGKGRLEEDERGVVPKRHEHVLRDWLSERAKVAKLDEKAALFVSLSPRNMGERMGLNYIHEMIRARYVQAGVLGGHKTAHSLRHSAITNVIRHGGTLPQAQRFARHRSPDTTMIYVHEIGRMEHPPEDLIDYGDEL